MKSLVPRFFSNPQFFVVQLAKDKGQTKILSVYSPSDGNLANPGTVVTLFISHSL